MWHKRQHSEAWGLIGGYACNLCRDSALFFRAPRRLAARSDLGAPTRASASSPPLALCRHRQNALSYADRPSKCLKPGMFCRHVTTRYVCNYIPHVRDRFRRFVPFERPKMPVADRLLAGVGNSTHWAGQTVSNGGNPKIMAPLCWPWPPTGRHISHEVGHDKLR